MEPDYGEGGGAAVEPSLSLRPMQCQQGELVRLDGSARFSHEGTSVLAAVAGPVAVQKRSELVGRATVDVVWKPASGAPGAEAKQMESILRQIVEGMVLVHLHPRTLIRVVVQELHADGSLLAVAVNAVCVALLDAGLPMRSTFGAVNVAMRADGSLQLDPTAMDEEASAAHCTFVYQGVGQPPPASAPERAAGGGEDVKVPQLLSSVPGGGSLGEDAFWRALARGRAAFPSVASFIRKHAAYHSARGA